jgi:hypothetical protein
MSYQIYDENGYVADFGTTRGTHDYLAYLRGLDREELMQFVNEGFDIVPEALEENLEDINPPKGDLYTTHENFLNTLSKCKGIVILSDGLNDDLEDAE